MKRLLHIFSKDFLVAAAVLLILLTGCSLGKQNQDAEGSSEVVTPKTPLNTIDVLDLEWKGFE